ncbi:MAG: sigma-54 dependent transcriptional regulator [Porticoccaceae bacterium]
MTLRKALIIDDEPDIRELLTITLEQLDLVVTEAGDLAGGIAALKADTFDFCLTDMRLPDGDGLNLIDHIQLKYPELPVAMITAHGNTDMAVDALQRGAFDFVSKPVQLERLRALVQTALKLSQADSPSKKTAKRSEFIGQSPAINQLRDQIDKVARSQAPVFIYGESGSGKEIVARSIHYQGPRAEGAFVPVNCGAIPSELMESEFFGHLKGSFTGAYQDKQGLFEAANGGTLFLDEVADLPLSMQVKLLRSIQEKTVRPVGDDKEVNVDVRILSATHKNLEHEVATGRFRQDLYYRINVIEIQVPSLQEHAEDIPELAAYFLQKLGMSADAEVTPQLSPQALSLLSEYGFPGNVRELENMLERAYTLCQGDLIQAEDLQFAVSGTRGAREKNKPEALNANGVISNGLTSNGLTSNKGEHSDQFSAQSSESALITLENIGNLDEYLANIERSILEKTLQETRWNKTAAAEKLGITFRQIRYKLKKLGID